MKDLYSTSLLHYEKTTGSECSPLITLPSYFRECNNKRDQDFNARVGIYKFIMQRPNSKTVRKREREKEKEKELSLSLWPSLAGMANEQGWKNLHKRSML